MTDDLDPWTGAASCIAGLEKVISQTLLEYGDNAYLMKDVHGRPLLGDMLAALGQLYAAQAALAPKTPRQRPGDTRR